MVLLACAGCATNTGPSGPDLEPSKQQVDERIASIDAAETAIENHLDQLQELEGNLATMLDQTDGADLPFSLLRLVAMNCLNTEYDQADPELVDLDGTPLTCRPAHLERLREALADRSITDRDAAHDLLYSIDQARQLRGMLRQRLATLPEDANDHHAFIADERARMRQLEADLEQDRNLYSTGAWRAVTDDVDDYHRRLDELEAKLRDIADVYPEWPARVDELVSSIYFNLTDMRGRNASSMRSR